MLNEELSNRLYNCKFNSALQYLDGQCSDKEKVVIEALATLYGNSGWLGGLTGIVVAYALNSIGVCTGCLETEEHE